MKIHTWVRVMTSRILLVFFLALFCQSSVLAMNGNDWFNHSMPVPLTDDGQGAKYGKRFESNYSGPSFSTLKKVTELAEFSCSKDGEVKWIYHPDHFRREAKFSKEMLDEIDAAIRKSGPITGKEARGVRSYALVINPENSCKHYIYFCYCEHLCQFCAYVSEKRIARWANNFCFKNNTQEIKRNLFQSKLDTTAACWLCVNPDNTIEKILPLPINTGKTINKSLSNRAQTELISAVKNSKLTYEGAPTMPNQPLGLVVLYRPGGRISALPYLYDCPPYEAIWTKNETKTCECSD